MKEIECPSCEALIPDDSKYCDQCGAELLECLKCGALGTDSFCPECGGAMVARKTDKAKDAVNVEENPLPYKGSDDSDNDGKTIGGRRKSVVLKARNGGFILKPSHEAIIGRNGGDYDSQLSSLNLISRRHGKFMQRGRDWYIVDFGSTNGTYVNDTELQPNQPVKFKVGDIVDIGTYIFDVIEQ